ncbi:MAG: tetratricopeptide repeat protein [Polyangiaceae bacterium]|jgi:hypothetical protein
MNEDVPHSAQQVRELATSLEQEVALATQGVSGEVEPVRRRLANLYLRVLHDPTRAAEHARGLLEHGDVTEETLQLADELLDHPSVAPSIAEVLSATHARLGNAEAEAKSLAIEIKSSRPPRREAAKKRLSELRFRVLGDHRGALDLIEPLVAMDPTADDMRRLYIDIAESIGNPVRAAETLRRSVRALKDLAARERVGFDIGCLYLRDGEISRARTAFLDVLSLNGLGPETVASARRLVDLEGETGDAGVIGAALDVIVRNASEASVREDAASRLLALHQTKHQRDVRVVAAYEALTESARAEEALRWLRPHYEKLGDGPRLAQVLRKLAARARDVDEARTLALESLKLSGAHGGVTADAWRSFLSQYGPHHEAHVALAEILEQSGDWAELVSVLEADLAVARADERSEILARLGSVRRTHLGDCAAALEAFRLCLVGDPTNARALAGVEGLVAAGPLRLQACDVLEPVYELMGSVEGKARVLETRAELLEDETARLAAVRTAVDVLGGGGRKDLAERVCLRAIERDPSSIALHSVLDDLVRDREQPAERLARYVSARAHSTSAERRAALGYAIAAIQRDDLGDLTGALATLTQIVRADPKSPRGHEALIDAAERAGDGEALLAALEDARDALEGPCRRSMTLRLAQELAGRGSREDALALCEELLATEPLDRETLQAVADLARGESADDVYRAALERLCVCDAFEDRRRALELLGDFHFSKLADAQGAARLWKTAAKAAGADEAGREQARFLYERVLQAVADDAESAEALVEHYSAQGDWLRLPELLRVVIRSLEPARAMAQLLLLEESAIEARSQVEYLSLADELLLRMGRGARDLELERSRVRVLASDSGRERETSNVFRQIISAHQLEEDVQEYERFIEGLPQADLRHSELRWLFHWRASHVADPFAVLRQWAMAEEEYGEPEAAVAVYERIAALAGHATFAAEALCRLRLKTGDFSGGLLALEEVRRNTPPEGQLELNLRIAKTLFEDLARPVDAAFALAPALAVRPAIAEVREIGRRLLVDPATQLDVLAHFEESASKLDALGALSVFEFLTSTRAETQGLADARLRWFTRVLELADADREAALSVLSEAVVELPNAASLWLGFESLARAMDRAPTLAIAYRRALVESAADPEAAQWLGSRLVALEAEFGLASPDTFGALARMLMLAPEARWAFDRVKLALGSQSRWDDLFALYDRLVGSTPGDAERAALLHEAALAARDIAFQPDRAVAYFEALRCIRHDDASLEAALDRLYVRQGHSRKLIDLLGERVDRETGFRLRELRHRIASLWLDLGNAVEAQSLAEVMLENHAAMADVTDVLERVVALASGNARNFTESELAPQWQAIARLKAFYAETGRADHVVRLVQTSLALAKTPERRAACVKELVSLRIDEAAASIEPFANALAVIEEGVAEDLLLAKVAYRSILSRALWTWRKAQGPRLQDAQNTAFAVLGRLAKVLLAQGDVEGAFRFLLRASALRFEPTQRRALRAEAATVRASSLSDPKGAIEILSELIDADGDDEVAARYLPTLTRLLEEAGNVAQLARLWESQGSLRARAGRRDEACTCWERGAAHWETEREWDHAIAAYREGAALASSTSYEALARIHTARQSWDAAAEALEWLCANARPHLRGARALELSDVCVKIGNRARSRSCLEDAIRVAPETDRAQEVRARLIALCREDAVYKRLVELLAFEADATPASESARQIEYLREAAELSQSKLGDAAGAASLLEKAVSRSPGDGAIRLALVDVLEVLERWEDVASVLEGTLERTVDERSRDRALIHRRLARALVRCDRFAEALEHLRAADEVCPGLPSVLFDLGRVALELGDLDLSEATYRSLLLVVPEAGVEHPPRAEVFLDLAEIFRRRGEDGRAADLVDSAFEEAYRTTEEFRSFEASLLSRRRFDLLARAKESRVLQAPTLVVRAAALEQWVAVWSEHLGRSADLRERIARATERITRDFYEEVVTDPLAWGALVGVQGALGDEEARLRTMRKRIDVLCDAAARPEGKGNARAWLHQAGVLCSELGALDRAAVIYERLVDDDRADLEAWRGLEGLASDSISRARVRDRLQSSIRDMSAGPVRTQLRLLLANILLADAELAPSAAGLLAEAAREDPLDGEASHRLWDVLERAGRTEDLIAALESRLGSLRPHSDAYALVETMWRLGRTLELAGRSEASSTAYDAILEIDGPIPLERAIVLALTDLDDSARAGEGARRDALVTFLGRAVGRVQPPAADAIALRLTEGLLRASRPDDARKQLESLLARNPHNGDALRVFSDMMAERGDWASATEMRRRLLVDVLDRGGSKGELVQVALSTAEAAGKCDRLDHVSKAVADALDVLAKRPLFVPELVSLCRAIGAWSRLADVLEAEALRREDPADKVQFLLQAATTLLEHGEDPSNALRVVHLARSLQPESMDGAVLFARANVALGRIDDAIAALRGAVLRARGHRGAIAALHLEIAKAYLAVDDLLEASESLKEAFAADWRTGDTALLLGLLSVDIGDDKTAERALTAVTTLPVREGNPVDVSSKATGFYLLASMAHTKGDLVKAKLLAAKAVDMSDHPDARGLLRRLAQEKASSATG